MVQKALMSDDDLQEMFRLSYYLHPNRLVALCITLDSCNWLLQIQKDLSRRPPSEHPHKQRIPAGTMRRLAVYSASQTWEFDQESAAPQKPYRYQPNGDDHLIRYVELLIRKTIDRPCCYAAVAIGHFLYSYPLTVITEIAPDYFDQDNIRRVSSYISKWIDTRYENGEFSRGQKGGVVRRPATERERALITETLEVLSPKYSLTFQMKTPGLPVLSDYFGPESSRSELQRIRAIVDPTYVGFEALVNEYSNGLQATSKTRVTDPLQSLHIPKFDDKILVFPQNENQSQNSTIRIADELTQTELAAIVHNGKQKM